MRIKIPSWAACGALLIPLAACGADEAGDLANDERPGGNAGSLDGGSASPGVDDDAAEEPEGDLDFQLPQAGKTVVYIPNPVTNRVAVVNASTFGVETFSSGLGPRAVATVPGEDIAVVVNERSLDVSVLRTVDGATTLTRVPVGHPINAVAIAPDGKHALVYFQSLASAKGADTHQDASIIALSEEPAVWAVSVGFRPRAVRFDAEGTGAYVITEDGVSVVRFDDDAEFLRVEQIGLANALGSSASDVQISADGAYAVARSEGLAELTLVDLGTGDRTSLRAADLGNTSPSPDGGVLADAGTDAGADAGTDAGVGNGALDLTDLDLSPDGAHAYAVLRGTSTLLDIPLPAGFEDPTQIVRLELETPGVGALRVAADGALGVLYSTAASLQGVLLVDLGDLTRAPRPVRLRKMVRAVAIAADGEHLFVLHAGAQSGGANGGDMFSMSEGFSLVSVDDEFAKFEPTDVPIREGDLLVSPDGQRVFSLLRAANGGALLTSNLDTLRTLRTGLARTPSSVGMLPDVDRVFVGQESEGGMITFLDRDGEVERTLSGFELASRVRQ